MASQYNFNEEDSIFDIEDEDIAGHDIGSAKSSPLIYEDEANIPHYPKKRRPNKIRQRKITLAFAIAAIIAFSIMICTAVVFFSSIAELDNRRLKVDEAAQKKQELQEQIKLTKQQTENLDKEITALQEKIAQMAE